VWIGPVHRKKEILFSEKQYMSFIGKMYRGNIHHETIHDLHWKKYTKFFSK
jgi:hypothetical protein